MYRLVAMFLVKVIFKFLSYMGMAATLVMLPGQQSHI